MKNKMFQIEIIESGVELSNNELFDVLGGAADCVCKCVLNFRILCQCAVADGYVLYCLPVRLPL